MSSEIKHAYLKSTEIILPFGKIKLDGEGKAEISDEQAKLIEGHPDFEIKQVVKPEHKIKIDEKDVKQPEGEGVNLGNGLGEEKKDHPLDENKILADGTDVPPAGEDIKQTVEISPEEDFRKSVAGYDRAQLIEAALIVNPEIKKNLSNAEYVEIIVAAKFPKE